MDWVFERSIEKLGLLGAETVESLAYVYGNLNGFRNAIETISEKHVEMEDSELKRRFEGALKAISCVQNKGDLLVITLKERAAQTFRPWFLD